MSQSTFCVFNVLYLFPDGRGTNSPFPGWWCLQQYAWPSSVLGLHIGSPDLVVVYFLQSPVVHNDLLGLVGVQSNVLFRTPSYQELVLLSVKSLVIV